LIFDVSLQVGDEPFESLTGLVVKARGLQPAAPREPSF
jgi:hypothetical protein